MDECKPLAVGVTAAVLLALWCVHFLDPGRARYTMSKQSERRMRRVCAGTPVHYEQTVREEDAARVCVYTGTL